MKDSILTLLTSKRFMVAVVTVVLNVALVFGVELDAEKLTTLLTAINTIALALIGGISVSDHGKAMGQPAGVDHKGRGERVIEATPAELAAALSDLLDRPDNYEDEDDDAPTPNPDVEPVVLGEVGPDDLTPVDPPPGMRG